MSVVNLLITWTMQIIHLQSIMIYFIWDNFDVWTRALDKVIVEWIREIENYYNLKKGPQLKKKLHRKRLDLKKKYRKWQWHVHEQNDWLKRLKKMAIFYVWCRDTIYLLCAEFACLWGLN